MDFYGFLRYFFRWEKLEEVYQQHLPGTPVMKAMGVPLFNGCKNLEKKDRMGNLGCTDFWMNRVECCGTQKKHHRKTSFWGVFLCKTLHGHI